MKIKQWIGASILIMTTACSNQVFSPSEEFVEFDQSKSISPEELIDFAQRNDGVEVSEGIKITACAATSDKNIAEDLEREPVAIPLEEFGPKVRVLSKVTHDGANYLLIKTESDKHIWLAY